MSAVTHRTVVVHRTVAVHDSFRVNAMAYRDRKMFAEHLRDEYMATVGGHLEQIEVLDLCMNDPDTARAHITAAQQAQLNATNILPKNSPLIAFARNGSSEDLVRAMLVEKLDLTTFDFKSACVDSDLPLIGLAAGGGSFSAAQILIDAGACRNTALLYASATDRVIKLLKAGADPNHVAADGTTPLMARCADLPGSPRLPMTAMEATGLIGALLNAGANVHAVDTNGYQAIHHAVLKPGDTRGFDRMIIIKMLVGRGANLRATTADGTTVMELAARSGCAGVVEHLLEEGFDVGDAFSDPAVVRRLLEAGSVKKKTTFLQRVVACVTADTLNAVVDDDLFPVWTFAVAKHTANDCATIARLVNGLASAGADLPMRTLNLNGSERFRVQGYLEKRPILQERVTLLEAADEAMAESTEPAQPRARRRL